ncbi:MAG: class I SAM-dependent methyltransferase [Solirubrobacterales bacterium]
MSHESREQVEHRRRLLDGLSGRVLEVGAGNGRNFALYPAGVSEVVAVEPEPYLRRHALATAESAPVPVRVVDGLADRLPFDDGAFDAAVTSLVLCSVSDQGRALAELRRVIRPGGGLRFYEHVIADEARLARLQRTVDRLFWPRVGGGCHTSRDTAGAITAAGFQMERCTRLSVRPSPMMALVAPHILGVARRP